MMFLDGNLGVLGITFCTFGIKKSLFGPTNKKAIHRKPSFEIFILFFRFISVSPELRFNAIDAAWIILPLNKPRRSDLLEFFIDCFGFRELRARATA